MKKFSLLLSTWLMVTAPGWSTAAPSLQDQFLKGRAVLARAVAYSGGIEKLRDVPFVNVHLAGASYDELEAHDLPDGSRLPSAIPLSIGFSIDLRNHKYQQETQLEFGDGYRLRRDFVALDNKRYTIWPNARYYTVAPGDGSDVLRSAGRYLPPLLLKRAAENLRSVVWVGEANVKNEICDVIEFSWDEKTRYRLNVTRKTGAVLELGFLAPDERSGELYAEVHFGGEQAFDGILIPTTITQLRRGKTFLVQTVTEAHFNAPAADKLFEIPAGYNERAEFRQPILKEVASGIFYVNGITVGPYGTPVVEFKDFLVVFDAPDPEAAQSVIAEVRKRFGTKPIKYVVLSHFHSDHASGIRPYIDVGATVITTRENEKILQQMANSRPHLFDLDPKPTANPDIHFQFIEGHGEISDGKRTMRIVNVGPTTHVQQLLFAYVNDTKTVIEGDLFGPEVEFNPTYDALLNWIKKNEVPVSLVLGVHHDAVTLEQVIQNKLEHEANSR